MQWFIFFPQIDEVEQIHTHKGPSNKSVFLYRAPSVNPHPFTPIIYIYSEHACLCVCVCVCVYERERERERERF